MFKNVCFVNTYQAYQGLKNLAEVMPEKSMDYGF